MQITFTDAERAFADSPRGRMLIARAANSHVLREAHKGSAARPWTDVMQAETIRSLAMQDARSTVGTAAMLADSAAAELVARATREAAKYVRDERTRNAWKGR